MYASSAPEALPRHTQYPAMPFPLDAVQVKFAVCLPIVGVTAVSCDGPVEDEAGQDPPCKLASTR